jgi:hypothetical protein
MNPMVIFMGYLGLMEKVRYGKNYYYKKSEEGYIREAGVLTIKILAVYEKYSQDPSELNGDNMNSIRCEPSRHFRNKKREYL